MTQVVKRPWHQLSQDEQRAALSLAATATGREVVILEKDIWVVWALHALFSTCAVPEGQTPSSERVHMVFKGGTSLSKAYGHIDRFSEDIDITLELPAADGRFPADIRSDSASKRSMYRPQFRERCIQHLRDHIVPALQAQALQDGCDLNIHLDLRDQETPSVSVEYPSVAPITQNYMLKTVKLEFGARNVITPSHWVEVSTYLADVPDIAAQIDLPQARPAVLSAERTFLEKATAVHALCGLDQKDEERLVKKCHRFARHLHDLYALDARGVATLAMADRALVEDVIQTKKAFFSQGGADYDAVLTGGTRLIPDGRVRALLAQDYADMQQSGMLGTSRLPFKDLLTLMLDLQRRMREAITAPVTNDQVG